MEEKAISIEGDIKYKIEIVDQKLSVDCQTVKPEERLIAMMATSRLLDDFVKSNSNYPKKHRMSGELRAKYTSARYMIDGLVKDLIDYIYMIKSNKLKSNEKTKDTSPKGSSSIREDNLG